LLRLDMRRLALLLLLGACSAPPPWARLEPGTSGEASIAAPLEVPRAQAAPKIDGILDEDVWTRAAKLGPLVDPGSGAPAPDHPVASIARMSWDERALYLGFVVHDRKPDSPFARDEVDPHVWGAASGIELMLQPGDPGDNRDYYELQVDAHGAIFDSHFDDYNAPISREGAARRHAHQDWSSRIERAVHVGSGYYAVELALPWASLAAARVPVPPRPGDVWRANLYAFRDGQRRALAWSPLRGRGNFHRSERFGKLRYGAN